MANFERPKHPPAILQDGSIAIPEHISRTAALGELISHICSKVPIGGGKTLLDVAALERIRQETGFVLWIVPIWAIYEQTIKAFKTREHPYRQMLERISGGRAKLLQKADCFTKQDIASYLCIMMLMLLSANRQKNKDFLKIFRGSGRYTSFFSEQDAIVNQKLSEQHPNLENNNSGDFFEPVYESDFNNLEQNFALYLENSDAIYLAQNRRQAGTLSTRLETTARASRFCRLSKRGWGTSDSGNKGYPLEGQQRHELQKKLLKTLENTYRTALDRGKMTVNEPPATFRMMFEETWQEEINNELVK